MTVTYSKERDQAAGLTDSTLAFTAAMYTITAMILSGVFYRHRKLKFAFGGERRGLGGRGAGADGLPLRARSRMGGSRWHQVGPQAQRDLPRAHHLHVHARSHRGEKNRELIGVKNMMWGSDFPHFDGTWPHSIEVLEGHFGGVSVNYLKRIARQNVIESLPPAV
jgi:hypothetical protein